MKLLRTPEFEDRFQMIYQERDLLVEITAHTNHKNHHIFILRWWTHQGLEFVTISQSAILNTNAGLMEKLSTWSVTREFYGLSESMRIIMHDKLKSKFQGTQEWIRFGRDPAFLDPSPAEQARCFPEISFQVEADIFSLFKMKPFLVRSWEESFYDLAIRYKSAEFLAEFQQCRIP
jgi:hypothetical protein